MGSGKTAQSLHAIEKLGATPCLVVCPASVKFNWQREVDMWFPGRTTTIVNGRKGDIPKADYVIINYDLLVARLPQLRMIGFKGLIADEFHYAKNAKAKRSIALNSLAVRIPVKFGLTGTPILNRPVELPQQLKILGHLQNFGGDWKFKQRYCDARKKWTPHGSAWDFNGASNLPELRKKLFEGPYAIAIRRTKDQILRELPPKQIVGIPVDLKGKRQYQEAEKALRAHLIEKGLLGEGGGKERRHMAEVMEKGGIGALAQVRQALALGKLDMAKQWIQDFLDGSDMKLVVFAHHREVVTTVFEHFKDVAVKLQGGDSQRSRQDAIDRFQGDDNVRIFVGNIQAAGEGITLTAASNVLFLELAWSPALLEQAEDRCHRIGATAESVNIYYMLGVDTLEEDLLDIIRQKRKVVDGVLG